MGTYHKPIFKLFVFVAVLQYTLPAQAQLTSKKYSIINITASNDTLATTKDHFEAYPIATTIAKASKSYNEDLELANAEVSINKPHERKELMGYLKQITTVEEVNYNQSRKKFLYGLANVFAKLKLYPLAMKCFLKTTEPRHRDLADSLQLINNTGYLAVNAIDDSLVAKQAAILNVPGYKTKNSKATTYKYIVSTFDDGKKAAAYAMLFHVKQPVPGKRKIFVLGNTGHTFITLIKYNTDSTYSSFSFGFYPKKRNPLSATPVVPVASSVFKDDTYHQWDEVLGKFISKKRFEKILALTRQYDKLEYHLSNNNCTDFGIKAAGLAGINIDETTGKWPLGHGNNPAVTGQSILQGKFNDTDSVKAEGLFINTVAVAGE